MSIWATEAAMIARIRERIPGVRVVQTFEPLDWAGEDAPRVGVHVVFDGLSPADQTGRSVLMLVRWSVHVYLDVIRATKSERERASGAVSAVLQALVGWEPSLGLRTIVEAGPQTGFDGRLARVSLAFSTPSPETGLA